MATTDLHPAYSSPLLSRRRFISISAAAAGLGLIGHSVKAGQEGELRIWRGEVLGAQAEMKIHHPDEKEGERLITLAVTELRRLERQFSLYYDQSELLLLNRTGLLEAPSIDFIELLTLSHHFSELTGGLFDPTVQPLWNLYLSHFSRKDADAAGPEPKDLRAALDLVGMRHVIFNEDRVVLGRKGMGLTFNGIGQGYITDKVVALLRQNGIERSLIDLGETRAIGPRPDGTPWRIAIADPVRADAIMTTLSIADRALATSGGYGFRFDTNGRFNHIFNPVNGLSANRYASVSIVHDNATAADALATAACLMPGEKIGPLLSAAGGGEAYVIKHSGETESIRA